MPTPDEIAKYKVKFAVLSDAELIAEKNAFHTYTEMHIAAVQILHERQLTRELANHAKLLAEIKRPHWSVSPSFYLLIVSVLLTAAALAIAFLGLSQVQKSSASNQPSPKEQTSAAGNSSNSLPPSSNSPVSQTGKARESMGQTHCCPIETQIRNQWGQTRLIVVISLTPTLKRDAAKMQRL